MKKMLAVFILYLSWINNSCVNNFVKYWLMGFKNTLEETASFTTVFNTIEVTQIMKMLFPIQIFIVIE